MEKKKDIIYIIETDVGNYCLYGCGRTPTQAINVLWKEYKEHWMEHCWGHDENPTKKEWLEWHGISEDACEEVEIGKAWYR